MKKTTNEILYLQLFVFFIICATVFIFWSKVYTDRDILVRLLATRYDAVNRTLFGNLYLVQTLSLAVYTASLIAIWCQGLSRLHHIFALEYSARHQRLSSECIWLISLSILPLVAFLFTYAFASTFIGHELSFILSLVSLWLTSINFIHRAIKGDWEKEPPVLRGAELTRFDEALLESEEATANDPLRIFWGGLYLPWHEATYNFLACGSIGSGKTTHILLHMKSTLQHFGKGLKQRAIIYSYKRDILSYLDWLEPECPVYVFDPYDERFTGWDIANDLSTEDEEVDAQDVMELAEALIPADAKTSEQYFRDVAVVIIAAVIEGLMLKSPRNWSFSDLVRICQNQQTITDFLMTVPEKKHIIEQHAEDIGKTFRCVISTALKSLTRLEPVAVATDRAKDKISLRRLIEDDEEFILVLHGHPTKKTTCSVFNRLVITYAGMVAMSLDETKTSPDLKYRRTWFYLDEIATLENLRILPELSRTGRGFGIGLLMGIQDIAQLDDIYNVYGRRSIVNNFTHRIYLRNEDAETQEWCSKQLGNQDVVQTSFSQNTSFHSNSWGNNQAIHNRPLVLPSEFGELPKASRENGVMGYAKNRFGSYKVFLPPSLLKELPEEDKEINIQKIKLQNIREGYVQPFTKKRRDFLYSKPDNEQEQVEEEENIREVINLYGKASRKRNLERNLE